MSFINYNGRIFPEGTALVSADNRGLRYGDGLFETMKMKSGKIIFEAEHFERLWKGLEVLQFEFNNRFTKDGLVKEITALCIKNRSEAFARIRLNIVRGDGGLYDAKNYAPNYVIQCWPLSLEYEHWNSNGLVLGLFTEGRKSCDLLANIKHNNYLPYVLAALHARKEKWNDAILLNTHMRVCDTTIANLFVIRNGIIYTPSLGEGCVAGVMRRTLISHLQMLQWEVQETELGVEDVLNSDEVFLTNSMYNIRWVASIGNKNYSNTITQKIYNSFVATIC